MARRARVTLSFYRHKGAHTRVPSTQTAHSRLSWTQLIKTSGRRPFREVSPRAKQNSQSTVRLFVLPRAANCQLIPIISESEIKIAQRDQHKRYHAPFHSQKDYTRDLILHFTSYSLIISENNRIRQINSPAE